MAQSSLRPPPDHSGRRALPASGLSSFRVSASLSKEAESMRADPDDEEYDYDYLILLLEQIETSVADEPSDDCERAADARQPCRPMRHHAPRLLVVPPHA